MRFPDGGLAVLKPGMRRSSPADRSISSKIRQGHSDLRATARATRQRDDHRLCDRQDIRKGAGRKVRNRVTGAEKARQRLAWPMRLILIALPS